MKQKLRERERTEYKKNIVIKVVTVVKDRMNERKKVRNKYKKGTPIKEKYLWKEVSKELYMVKNERMKERRQDYIVTSGNERKTLVFKKKKYVKKR